MNREVTEIIKQGPHFFETPCSYAKAFTSQAFDVSGVSEYTVALICSEIVFSILRYELSQYSKYGF